MFEQANSAQTHAYAPDTADLETREVLLVARADAPHSSRDVPFSARYIVKSTPKGLPN